MPAGVMGFSSEPPKIVISEVPTKFIDIPDEVSHLVSVYMTTITGIKKPEKKVDIELIIKNAKNMFKSGAKWNDELWFQHCASSVREIILFIDPEDFHKAMRCIPSPDNRTDEEMQNFFSVFCNIKAYLSDVVHFVPDPRKGKISMIYPKESFGTMNKDDFYKMEPEIIERISIELIYALYFMFKKYCFAG